MVALVIEEEIKIAFWTLKAFKALGSDGLHIGIFSTTLAICGQFYGGGSQEDLRGENNA